MRLYDDEQAGEGRHDRCGERCAQQFAVAGIDSRFFFIRDSKN